jgi:hypothetical protein
MGEKIKYQIELGLIADMPLCEVERIYHVVMNSGGSSKAKVEQKVAIAALYEWPILSKYSYTADGKKLSVKEFHTLQRRVGNEFIHIHRLNYMVYNTLLMIHDWLEDSGLMRNNTKRWWKMIERTWTDYQTLHKKTIDQATWVTVQDHMAFACYEVDPLVPQLEVAIRDYLIQHRTEMLAVGQKDDITLLTRIQVGLMFCAALSNSRRHFFNQFVQQFGVDFRFDFVYADITGVAKNFVCMCGQMGVKFAKDKDGDMVLMGIDFDKSLRVQQAWDAIVDVVTNEELMDEAALKAINLNPVTKAGYEREIAKADADELQEALGTLSTKFKVSKL